MMVGKGTGRSVRNQRHRMFDFLSGGQVFFDQRDYIWEDHALHAMPTEDNQHKQHTPLHVNLALRNLDGLPTVDEEGTTSY